MFCEPRDCKLLSIFQKINSGFVSKNCPLISSVMFIFLGFSLFVVSDLFILVNFILFMMMYNYFCHLLMFLFPEQITKIA